VRDAAARPRLGGSESGPEATEQRAGQAQSWPSRSEALSARSPE
jgi:hypothetical protein